MNNGVNLKSEELLKELSIAYARYKDATRPPSSLLYKLFKGMKKPPNLSTSENIYLKVEIVIPISISRGKNSYVPYSAIDKYVYNILTSSPTSTRIFDIISSSYTNDSHLMLNSSINYQDIIKQIPRDHLVPLSPVNISPEVSRMLSIPINNSDILPLSSNTNYKLHQYKLPIIQVITPVNHNIKSIPLSPNTNFKLHQYKPLKKRKHKQVIAPLSPVNHNIKSIPLSPNTKFTQVIKLRRYEQLNKREREHKQDGINLIMQRNKHKLSRRTMI